MVYCLDLWTQILDEQGGCLDAIYLDFSKAFDSVPHQRLLNKLRTYGINGNILSWCESFLTGRRQRVVINSVASDWSDVLSGVPQGSVLGPLLFLLFINDMPDVVHNVIALFADDAKLFSSIRSDSDMLRLRHDIYNLTEWSDKWQLQFNIGKCKSLHLGHNNKRDDYFMRVGILEKVEVEKDLGVHVDEKLSFKQHIEYEISKANQILGLIRRSFDYLDARSLVSLYTSRVRPLLEYCNVVAYPRFSYQCEMLESVQRRATKMIPQLKSLDYAERLKLLKLPSLYYRRARGDIFLEKNKL